MSVSIETGDVAMDAPWEGDPAHHQIDHLG